MAITLTTIADELSPIVKRGYAEGAKAYSPVYDKFMNVESSADYYWEELEAGGIGYLQQIGELEDVPTADFTYGSTKQYVATGRGLSIVVGRQTWKYQRLGIVSQSSKMLGMAVKKTVDEDCTALFNDGDDTYTTPDGLFIFDTAHINLYGGTYDNIPGAASALSISAVNNAYYLMSTTLRHDVAPGGNQPKYIMFHPNKASVVHAILKSAQIPGSANNDSNFMFNRLIPIENNLLNNINSWYLLSDKADHRMKLVWFMKPKMSRWTQDSNKSIHFDVVTDYDRGATSGLGLWGEYAAA